MGSGATGPDSLQGHERLRAIIRDRRLLTMLMAFGVMACVAISVIGFSSAYFTTESSSPAASISAASVDITLATVDQLIDGTRLKPGETRTGRQTITNLQHRARVELSATGLEGPLPGVLTVVVRQTAPAPAPGAGTAYQGLLQDLHDVELMTLDKDAQATWEIELTWPADETDPALAGASTGFDLEWVALSEPSVP